MRYVGNKVEDLKIAYIGGGSRGWAKTFICDLAQTEDMCGEIALYDVDYEAAKMNEAIGNGVKKLAGCVSPWVYKTYKTLGEALDGADFVIISITPGTYDEMGSDLHTPEKYGIYQSVGDTTGPAGVIRSLRMIPMMEEIALAVKEHCPKAWVINYSNPMSVCTRSLYAAWPEIKAFGCCHEVFGVQKLLARALKECRGIDGVDRTEVKVDVTGVNHFTWFTKAQYRDIDLIPVWEEFMEKFPEGYLENVDKNWMNDNFSCAHLIKYDLYKRFGYIATAADRHLAEFCPKDWYLSSPERVAEWKFALTPISWRKSHQEFNDKKSKRIMNGEEEFKFWKTGEEGIDQMRALLGLKDMVTNVNIPNYGQVPNLPIGACVEVNAMFTADNVVPVYAGPIPKGIYPLISSIVGEQEMIVEAGMERDLEKGFAAFTADPMVTLSQQDARALFDEMVDNTKEYLKDYFK